ncbi:Trp biosynthesis-associated membrane protein [Galactobacter caseinivorans]|uniref:Trp biosynthesis-associated membrane protein n=1 Tax=Galactobacter caseinivorans TaxID=2676123 RepID=UPI00131455D0|nr:Trp biosynthesis-associated membrane protein [Galactobacter caseinivorans]
MTETEPKRLLSRRNVILLGIAAGLVGLLGVTQTWITVPPPSSGVQLGSVAVSGADAASAVLALTVVGLACAVAATIAGKIARYIVAAVQFLVGAGVVGFVIPVLLDPHKAAAAKVSEAFGLQVVPDAAYQLSFWPVVSMVGGVLMVLAALALAWSSRGWTSGHRYERTTGGRAVVTNETMDDIDRWDAFTEGEDPTEGDGDVKGARYH